MANDCRLQGMVDHVALGTIIRFFKAKGGDLRSLSQVQRTTIETFASLVVNMMGGEKLESSEALEEISRITYGKSMLSEKVLASRVPQEAMEIEIDPALKQRIIEEALERLGPELTTQTKRVINKENYEAEVKRAQALASMSDEVNNTLLSREEQNYNNAIVDKQSKLDQQFKLAISTAKNEREKLRLEEGRRYMYSTASQAEHNPDKFMELMSMEVE